MCYNINGQKASQMMVKAPQDLYEIVDARA